MRSSKWTLKNRFGVIEMLFEFNFFPVSKECIDKIVSLVKEDEEVYKSETTKDMNGEIDVILKKHIEIKEKIERIRQQLKVDLNRGVLKGISFDKLMEELSKLGQENYALAQEKICNLIIKE